MSERKKLGVKSVDAATVQGWLDRDEIILVDVRETSEFDQEHIPGAMLLPMSKFDPELFPSVPGKKVVLHCAVGKRSESAGKMLLNEGHKDAVHMEGGIVAWKAAGYATEVQMTPPGEAEEEIFAPQCPPPGHVLKTEYLDPLKISRTELADKIGVSDSVVRDLMNGSVAVSVELSMRLASFFSTAADFWVYLQIDHDLEAARHQIGERIRNEVSPRTASE